MELGKLRNFVKESTFRVGQSHADLSEGGVQPCGSVATFVGSFKWKMLTYKNHVEVKDPKLKILIDDLTIATMFQGDLTFFVPGTCCENVTLPGKTWN